MSRRSILLLLHFSSWADWIYLLLDIWSVPWSVASSKTGVALIRLDAIGDFILWLDAAKEFRRLYPGKKVTLIANSTWANFAILLPYWDEVWSVDVLRFGRNLFYRWSVLWKVRKAGFEVAIHPTYSRTFKHGDSLIRVSAARERIGSVGDLSNISVWAKRVSDRWYTRLIPASCTRVMELERNAEFIRNLTGEDYVATLPSITFVMRQVLKVQENNYFVIFPGASWSGKRWPLENFADLTNVLQREFRWYPVLCGSMEDTNLCNSIANQLNIPCLNLAGKTSLAELAEVIRTARLLVCNDTSAVHIAAAVGTPAVCILGGGHYGRFMPYPTTLSGVKPLVADYPMSCFNCNWRCSQPHLAGSPMPCLENVSVNRVMDLVRVAVAQIKRN